MSMAHDPANLESGAEPEEGEGSTGRERLSALAQGVRADRPIALVGLMGAGKTTVGRRLALVLGLDFADADAEIEKAAGMSVTEIFQRLGEQEFRRGERRVIERLLEGRPLVLATGGGAFVQPATRELLQTKALTVWLRADLDVLMRRVMKRDTRPLLRGPDPRETMAGLMATRYPLYASADVTVGSDSGPHGATVEAVLRALLAHQTKKAAPVQPCGGESTGPA
jgi:shikimate kinase